MSINKAVQYRVWLNTPDQYTEYAAVDFKTAVAIVDGFANVFGVHNTGLEHSVGEGDNMEWVEWEDDYGLNIHSTEIWMSNPQSSVSN